MSGKVSSSLFFAILCFAAFPSFGSETNAPPETTGMMNEMRDPEDGAIDFSQYLLKAHGFLPAPIIITEPAVGYGAGLMLLFLHDSIENRAEKVKERNPDGTPVRLPPPSITGVMGFGTENGTWGAGLFHLGIWKDDTVRYMGALAYASVNYDYYPPESSDIPLDSIPVNLDSAVLLQQLLFRLGGSDFMAGANYKLISSVSKPDIGIPLPPPVEDGIRLQSGGASLILAYDNRDNIFTPNKGLNSEVQWTHYAEWLGSDTHFDIGTWLNRYWHPLTPELILGLRCDFTASGGQVPFYMTPGIESRGIKKGRYIGDYVIASEAEVRWDFTPRWSAIGFAGAGWTADESISDFTFKDARPSGGFGFRYLAARIFHLRMGVDIAFSEEDTAFYIVTGNGWNR